MKLSRLFAAAALSIGLAACSITGTAGGAPDPFSNSAGVADETLVDEKAYLVASAAFRGFDAGINTALDAGVLHGETAGDVQVLYRRTKGAMDLAYTAYEAGDADLLHQRLERLTDFIAEGEALLAAVRSG